MDNFTALIDKIIAFAHADKDIRAVILEGSFAAHSQVDDLSDYDIDIFTLDPEKYLPDDRWMSQFGEVLLYQKEQFPFYEVVIPTRLVLVDKDHLAVQLAPSTGAEFQIAPPGRAEFLQTIYDLAGMRGATASGMPISHPSSITF